MSEHRDEENLMLGLAEARALIKRAPVKTSFYFAAVVDMPIKTQPDHVFPNFVSIPISRAVATQTVQRLLENFDDRGAQIRIKIVRYVRPSIRNPDVIETKTFVYINSGS